MDVVIRADASFSIGSGHIRRCLAIAAELGRQGATVRFICRNHEGHMGDLIVQCGYPLALLPPPKRAYELKADDPLHAKWLGVEWVRDAQETIENILPDKVDWLIVDHYAIDSRWLKELRPYTNKILVIDDLADRHLDCDWLLDQTYGRVPEDYRLITPDHCRLLLGPRHALLRPEFLRLRPLALDKRRQFDGVVRRILVFMGGIDEFNITGKILESLALVSWKGCPVVEVVLGQNAPHVTPLKEQVEQYPFQTNVLINVCNMEELMMEADLAFGGAGIASWERCCLGLPTFAVGLAENQRHNLRNLDNAQVHISLGNAEEISPHDVAEQIEELLVNTEKMKQLSRRSFSMCDGTGTGRLGLIINPLFADDSRSLGLRNAETKDAKMVYDWQRHPDTRKYSNNPAIPSWQEHYRWMKNKLACLSSYFFIILHGSDEAGVLRLDFTNITKGVVGYLISIFINPEKYRLGIASGGLKMIQRLWSHSELYAQILPENSISLRLFRNAGFSEFNREENLYRWNPDSG